MDMTRRDTRNASAFTLIELLVVIAILALLAAVIFPVYAQAREKGRQTVCVSNTRQIANAVLMYAQDFEETLPPVAYETATGDDVTWPELLNPYVKNEGVYLCPSDTVSQRVSYGLNELAFVDLEDDSDDPPLTLADFQRPAETVMLGDMGTGDDYQKPVGDVLKMVEPGDDLDDEDDARPAARHFARVNIGFLDGHVKPMRLGDFYVNQTPLDRWFAP
jgi:prepilin-type N-terminal cleavage/methylation domain-containing protein/prepilin-type processing-associated H-X9-DG protein